MKFSQRYNLSSSQGELDFVDIDTDKDLLLFVDPYAIELNSIGESDIFYEYITSYFTLLLDVLRRGENVRAKSLTRHLAEPRETFLGFSKTSSKEKGPQGRGMGEYQANQLIQALLRSQAFKTGQLEDLSEVELFIPGVGADKVSDLTTNIIREPLIKYTQSMCSAFEIPTRKVAVAPSWSSSELRWYSNYQDLPVIDGKSVILVPKSIVRRRMSLDSQEFYQYWLDFLQAELEPTEALTSSLRGQNGKITKKNLKVEYKFDKNELAKFAAECPKLFQDFKDIAKEGTYISDQEIDPSFFYNTVARKLGNSIKCLPTGAKTASTFEQLILRAMTLLSWPYLTYPIVQRILHSGIQRVDIEFSNAAKEGFWWNMRHDSKIRCRVLQIECKNYNMEMGNKEFAQIIQRLSPERSRLGFIFYRKSEFKDSLKKRQQAALHDNQGYVITISDEEIVDLLSFDSSARDEVVNAFFDRKFRDLIGFN